MNRYVGQSVARKDAYDKISGEATYAFDLDNIPNMLICKFLASPRAHAKIISIDSSNAESLSGVVAVVTGKDWPAADTDLGRCAYVGMDGVGTGQLVNFLPLGAFRYYSENGAFSTRMDADIDNGAYNGKDDRDCDEEGYCNIHKQLNAGFEEAMFDEAEIIQAGGPVIADFGYRANVLYPGSTIALTFRLDLPEPCYGNFETSDGGSIFIWAEAI